MQYKNHINIILTLFSYLIINEKNILFRLITAFALMCSCILLNIIIPFSLKNIVGLLSNNQMPPNSLILLSYGIMWTIAQAAMHLRAIVMYRILERAMHNLGLKIFDHLNSLSANFHYNKKSGAITTAIEKAQQSIPAVLWGLIFLLLPLVVEISIVLSILLYYYSPLYGVSLVFVLVNFVIFTVLSTTWATKAQRQSNKQSIAVGASFFDYLLNFESIKFFAAQNYIRRKFNAALQKQEDLETKALVRMESIRLGQVIILGIGLTLITWLVGNDVALGNLEVGDFVLFNGYLLQLVIPLGLLGYIFRDIRKGLTDMENVMEILHTKPEIIDTPLSQSINESSCHILFNNVYFSYQGEKEDTPILKGVSFEVKPYQSLGVIGVTGSGKSTIAKLLYRFYDIQRGEIRINGLDVRNIKQQSLQETIGVVPQDTLLFNDTIYYNIAYARPSASMDEIQEAVKGAHLVSFIKKLPDGYDTVVGERGLKLSGGEKQRIAIARLLLKKPKIYIFDEATSSLDAHTEKIIQKNIQEISRKATSLIITHRLSAVTYADNIIVLDQGKIVEEGTHQELLSINGVYKELWDTQQRV